MYFSADCNTEENPDDPSRPYHVSGEYDPQTKTAIIYVGSIRHKVRYGHRLDTEVGLTPEVLGSKIASQTAAHETSHALDHIRVDPHERLREKMEYAESLLPPMQQSLSQNPDEIQRQKRLRHTQILKRMSSLTQDEYLREPEEARARATEAPFEALDANQYPVHIQFK